MMRIRGKYPFWGNRYVGDFIMVIKWNASFRWSVRPNYAWGTIETTNIGKTHSLDKRYWPLFSSCWWLFKWRESVTNISKMSTVNCLQNPSSSKSYSFVGSKSGLKKWSPWNDYQPSIMTDRIEDAIFSITKVMGYPVILGEFNNRLDVWKTKSVVAYIIWWRAYNSLWIMSKRTDFLVLYTLLTFYIGRCLASQPHYISFLSWRIH